MPNICSRTFQWLACLATAFLFSFAAQAQSLVPVDVGTVVNGFQDDFTGASLGAQWTPAGSSLDIYSVANGMLHVSTAGGDPNHLLCTIPGYDSSTQEVLARIRFTNFGTGDPARGGVGVAVDSGSSQGINFHFRDLGGRHASFLDDFRAWGPDTAISWQNNVWYWVRLRQDSSASQGGLFAKIWPADGTVAEPGTWQSWNYTSARAGYAGITAGSSSGISEFDVDYILIKAAGLPSITVAPAAFPLYTAGPAFLTRQPASTNVTQCSPAAFSVTADGTPPYSYQWYRNGVAIAGATNMTFNLDSAQPADDGAVFRVAVGNDVNGTPREVTSSNATLHVIADLTPPALAGAANAGGPDSILVAFTKPVTRTSATNLQNYRITSPGLVLPVVAATLASDQTNVLLTTSGQVEGVTYTLTVNGILDQCTGANVILTNSRATFTASAYAPADIGGATPAGSIVGAGGGYDLSGGGSGINGTADQFQFSYQQRSGDFDVRVRLDSLTGTDAWAEAGLMARETPASGSRFAAALATPSISGAFFRSRATASTPLTTAGSFPVNYPNTWLRLQRVGNQFNGYASLDGQSWTLLGGARMNLPGTVYFGFAVASHVSGQATTAAFRQLSAVTGATIAAPLAFEPMGQSSRLTSLVFSEVMYHPSSVLGPGGAPGNLAGASRLEFVELLNTLGTPEDIGGYQLDGDVHYTFPTGTVIPGGAFLVVARAPDDLRRVYGSGLSNVVGPYTSSFPNGAGKLQLRNQTGALFLEVDYDSQPPWPVAADGAGHSLVLARPSLGENDPRAWVASSAVGGSPGRMDPVSADPLGAVVINEFLGHADNPPQADFIELFNRGGQALDLGGCFLSDDPDTNKFAFPPNTVIQARGFLSVDSSQLGFSVKSEGETLYFRNPGQRVIDAVRFSGQANNLSFERVPDGGPAFRLLASPTPGGTNGGPYHNDIVINELMYHPASGNDDEQYVELYNRGKNPVNLGGWKFVSGINFTIPANTLLSPNGYLAVARNADRLRAMYTNLGPGNVVGNFGGSLAGSGERVALAMPSSWLVTNVDGRIGTNTIHAVVSEVTYHNGGRWGQWSAGGGSSLELIDPESDTTLAANWADSDETGKAPWTTVVTTGVLDNGFTPADQLQVLLQGAGECLIDDVQVLNASKVNLIANSSFETDARNWTAEGTEDQSSLDSTQGFNSGKSYRIRAVERGDNQVNRVRVPLTSNLPSGSTATIQAKIRWLKGAANVLLRLRGDWLEAVGAMTLPPNPGTPGAPNSRRVANAGPAISEVIHTPVLPADRQAVVVTARVNDPDGVANVTLKYRLDPATTYTTVAMKDDGTGGDSIAGDGVYSGTIPAQATGALIAFYVQAADRATAPTTTIFPNDAPKRECLVRFGEAQPTGNFPVYRIWMTQATLNTWNSRSRLNNTPLDVTFVLGNQRVIYNSRALFAGSPYISPGYCGAACGMCGYTLSFPEDDRLLGDTDFVLDWPGGHGGESTAMQEEMAYWIAARIGLPTCHRYIIRLHVNGVTDEQRGGVFEAVNQPSGDFVKAWTGSNNGDMFKVDRSFEFNDGGGLISDAMPTLQVFTTTGGAKKQARYRWSWNKRATDTPNNYTNIFNLVDAANAASPEPYTSAFESLVDMEEWMGIFAVEHIINNFDSWGHDIGKNMYIYKPYDGKWQLYMFDLDWLMLAAPRGPGNYTASSGPLFNSADPVVTRVYNHPPFRRAYFRAVQAAVDGPLAAENCNPLMDAKYSSLVANGVRYCDGSSLSSPSAVKTWFKDRRTALLTQLAKVAADFTVSGGDTFTTNASPLQLAGTAPVTVKTIQVNGIDWPVTWTTVTNWVLQVPLTRATSPLAITGLDRDGNPVSGAGKNVVANYTGAASALPVVLINEWMAANTTAVADISSGSAKYDDWFELYNPAGTTADLAGYYLTDTLDNKTQFKIPAGYPIPAGGHLLVWADNEPGQNVAGQPDLHVNFQLSAKGESIGLFAPDGSTIDAVTFGPQSDDVSQGRCPDGSTNIMAMPNFTPRAANNCAPAAPSPKLGPVTLKDGQLVLGWEATPGASYRVEYKDDLGAAQWTPLGSTVTAPGASVAISIDLSGATQRFFRVRVQ